ncbi:hypothetical protein, partial [Frankia sp. CiP1_Cm_nod1]|uniref:hypothetical protein n=1 Tax=Frankia sp. CiP1_Cm_nod1 TaxID=2897160 RepID=UPI0020253D3B
AVAAAGAPGSPSPGATQPRPQPAVTAAGTARVLSGDTAVTVGGGLVLSTGVVDLGAVNSSAAVELRSTGREPVGFRFAATPSWLSVAPATGTVAAGDRRAVTVTLDRSAAPAGVLDTSVAVATVGGDGKGGTLRVTAVVSGPPAIDVLTVAPAVVRTTGCPAAAGPTVSTVSVRATDSTGVFRVDLVAHLPDGRTATSALSLGEAAEQWSVWSGPVGPSAVPGPLSFSVTVTSLDGLRAQSSGSLEVGSCPAAEPTAAGPAGAG